MEELLFILGSIFFVAGLIAVWFVLDVVLSGGPGHPESLGAYMQPLAMYLRARFGIPEFIDGDDTDSESEPNG